MIDVLFKGDADPAKEAARERLEFALQNAIQYLPERNFTEVWEALQRLKATDINGWRELRGHYLTRSIFDMIEAENRFRLSGKVRPKA